MVKDPSTGRAFGARDHLGAKPFYYRASERGLAFATRAAALGALDGETPAIDEARVADACVPGLECIDRTSTFYRGVYRLPPGHRLTAAGGTVSTTPYWEPDPTRELRLGSDADYVAAFSEIFADAVRCRLGGSVASMLSGGLDSSTIVGFARAARARDGRGPLTTLSAITDDPGCEESAHIRAVLADQGLEPILIRPGDVAGFQAEIRKFASAMEEPFDDAMVLPLLMYAAARRRGFGAVLDGLDGDTVASHEPDVLDDMLRAGRFRLAVREARGLAGFYRGTYAPWGQPAKLLASSSGRVFTPGFVKAAVRPLRWKLGVRAALSGSIVNPELADRVGVAGRLQALWSHRASSTAIDARGRQARELTHPQLAAALERYHRVAASQGIEARHPLLDRRVVEFCLALPSDQKVRAGWSKWILRVAGDGLVPDDVRWRRGRWVRLGAAFLTAAIGSSSEFLAAELSGDLSELAPYADLGKVRALYRRHLAGDADADEPVWTAAVLSSWLRNTRSKRYDGGARANGPAALPVNPERDDGHSHSQEKHQDGFQNEVRTHA